MDVDRKRALAAFRAFLCGFDADDPKIALKIEHTEKVAELCDRIARAEGMADDLVDMAWLAGLVHDLGRFEQIRQFNTFSDAKSLSHAALSVRILFEEGHLQDFVSSDFSQDDRRALHDAVALHSAWKLPQGQEERTHALCTVLRDADKVDILRVNCENPTDVIYPFDDAALRASTLSPACVEAFYEHRTIETKFKTQPADYLLGHCCFAFELVYATSRKLAVEQGHLAKLMERSFANPQTQACFARMRAHLRAYLEEQLRM